MTLYTASLALPPPGSPPHAYEAAISAAIAQHVLDPMVAQSLSGLLALIQTAMAYQHRSVWPHPADTFNVGETTP